MTERRSHQGMTEPVTGIPEAILERMYVTMLRIRRVEEKIADLISEGKIICPCHLYIGQEAIATGICTTLRQDDWVLSTHRSHGHYIAKGGDVKALMAELYGRSTGCSRGRGGSMHLAFPAMGLPGSSAIVAGTIPLAVGAALAFSRQHRDSVAVAFFGDGAVNEGTWYESLNFAALKKLPVIFICENNLYSTHMPIFACLAETNIYRKAEMFGMPGVRVDGNDVRLVYRAGQEAVNRARSGNGPTLLECLTYRWRGHVGPSFDLDKGLRSQETLDYWMGRCPIKMLENRLLEKGIISQAERAKISKDIDREVAVAIVFAQESPYPDKNEMNDNVFRGQKDGA